MAEQKHIKQNKILLFMALFALLVFMATTVMSVWMPSQRPSAQQPPAIESESSSVSSESVESSASESENLPMQPVLLSDEELFTDALFVGNSCIEALFVQGYAMQADFLSGVGMTVYSVFNDPPARYNQPIADLIASAKPYSRIFILFGINEVGTDPVLFVENYSRLIDHIRAVQPQAEIYVQAILPVSRAVHERNLYLVNNDNVRLFNGLIYDLTVNKQVHFLNIYEALVDAEGFLPDGASNDGIHLSKDYNQIWINYLKEHVK